MRLQINRSTNAECFYVVRSTRKDGKNSNEVVESLGNLEAVKARAGDMDPYVWAKQYARDLTQQEKEQRRTMLIPFSQSSHRRT